MKSVLKYVLCLLAYYSGAASLYWLLFRRKTALVLTYHRVLSESEMAMTLSQPGMIVSASTFQRQIRYAAQTYRIIPLREMAERLRSNRISDSYCCITFDDGWRDIYANAFPTMVKEGVPATVFLATGLVNTNRLFWPERLAQALVSVEELDDDAYSALAEIDAAGAARSKEIVTASDRKTKFRIIDGLIERLKGFDQPNASRFTAVAEERLAPSQCGCTAQRNVVTWSEVGKMRKHNIEFGSHTVDHSVLTAIPHDDARAQISESKKHLEEKLGEEIGLFAYPNGDWSAEVRKMVEDAGYIAAVTTKDGTNDPSTDPFLIRRLNVHEGMSVSPWGRYSRAVFACEITGLLAMLRRLLARDKSSGQ